MPDFISITKNCADCDETKIHNRFTNLNIYEYKSDNSI